MALTQEQIDYAKRVMDGGSTSVSSGPRTFDDFYKSVGKEIPGSKPLKPKMTTTQKVFSPITAPITGAKKLWDVASGVYGGIKNYFTGGGWEDRKEEFKQNMEMLKNTDQSKPEAMWKNISTGLSFIGDVIGTGTDLAAAGIIGGGKEIEPLRKGVESLLETELAQEGFKILSEKMEDWDAWKAENPYVANAIEGVINIAGAQGAIKAIGGAAQATQKTVRTAASYADDVARAGWKSTKDVAKSFGNAIDDVAGATRAATGGIKETVGDVVGGAKKLVGKVDNAETGFKSLTGNTMVGSADNFSRKLRARSAAYKELEQPGYLSSLSPSDARDVAEGGAVRLTTRQKMAGIDQDIAKVIRQNPKSTKEYIDIAKARNVSNEAQTPLEYATRKIDEASSILNKKLNETGSSIGAFRKEFESKLVDENLIPEVFTKFDGELEKLNLVVSGGKVKQATGTVRAVTQSEINVLQDLYENLKVLRKKPTLKNVLDNRNAFDNRINFAKQASEASSVVDPVSRTMRKALADLNVKSVGPEQAAAIKEYSDFMDVKNQLDSFVKNKTGKEFLLKQVLSERGRNARELIGIVRKYTGIDLLEESTLAKTVTDLIGNDAQKGLFRQEISKATGQALSAFRGKTGAIDYITQKGLSYYADPEKVMLEMINNPLQKTKLLEKVPVKKFVPTTGKPALPKNLPLLKKSTSAKPLYKANPKKLKKVYHGTNSDFDSFPKLAPKELQPVKVGPRPLKTNRIAEVKDVFDTSAQKAKVSALTKEKKEYISAVLDDDIGRDLIEKYNQGLIEKETIDSSIDKKLVDMIKNSPDYKEGAVSDMFGTGYIIEKNGKRVIIDSKTLPEMQNKGWKTVIEVDAIASQYGFDNADDLIRYQLNLDSKTPYLTKPELAAHDILLKKSETYKKLNNEIESLKNQIKKYEQFKEKTSEAAIIKRENIEKVLGEVKENDLIGSVFKDEAEYKEFLDNIPF
jgi:hypothetical protein